jgi:N-acetylglucosamine-6-sulfatase
MKSMFGGVILALLALFLATPSTLSDENKDPERPNVVMILTDDMRADDLKYMPLTQRLLVEEGTSFENAFVPFSLCCPSRVSILRGQYTHNHEVWDNGPPQGGFPKFNSSGLEKSTVATWLGEEGYRTVYIGKYLNNYPDGKKTSFVPPGWDDWYGRIGPNSSQFYDYNLNENGRTVHYGNRPNDYYTDVLSDKATAYVGRESGERPFFMHLAVGAPHGPATPAERHEGMFSGRDAPRLPSFNEAAFGDKIGRPGRADLLSSRELSNTDETFRDRLRSLQAVDEMVQNLVAKLRAEGELDDTYIVFTSDNGMMMGEHRLTLQKQTPYEEAIRIPLVVRGPGVPADREREEMVLNIDFAPTFAEWADAKAPGFVDGRSLVPLLGRGEPEVWRKAFLLEHTLGDERYYGVRTATRKFVDVPDAAAELYELSDDPYELRNVFPAADRDLTQGLRERMERLKACSGRECREAENG